ncbi:class II aldolase/adducin family protein [bacterium]|nr:class II aldolase/adducin family protein [bacterium]
MPEPREGVLKFNCHWTKTRADTAWPWKAMDAIRSRLLAKGLVGVDSAGIGYGNVSLRIDKTDDFIVTGTQTGHLVSIASEHVTRVVGFDLEENRLDCQGPIQASSESMTHAYIYRQFQSISNVIHIHHQGMWEKYRNVLPTTSSQATYGTPEMARAIAALISDRNVLKGGTVIMGGHEKGLLFFGTGHEDAIRTILKHFSSWN